MCYVVSLVIFGSAIGLKYFRLNSESEGHPIDLSSFGIDYVPSPSKRSLYETHGTFSLPQYLKDLPQTSKDFESFACNGMLDFMSILEAKCPGTAEFKDFFAKVEDYMTTFKSGSKDIKVEMSDKSEKLFRAMSLLDGGKAGTVESWRMIDGMLSMGKLLAEVKQNGSKDLTFDQRKEVIGTMVKWARAMGLFVKVASEKKGKSIDLSSFGIDYTHYYSTLPLKGPNG
ncbi:unnamed protein product [Microthlaspi erraticum]|uniref:DUF1216 domain-containing protein n=1 Tax=Microthlaspi erraticum TaxID=1685480 RepID=A0A6D2JDL6_9BRAS|nr:unnamed protein product [Microthlaspi erraticum]